MINNFKISQFKTLIKLLRNARISQSSNCARIFITFSGMTLPFVLSHNFATSWHYTTFKIASWKLATCEASSGNTTPIKPTCCKQNCCASCVTDQSKESCSDDTKDEALPVLKPEIEHKIKEEITKYNVVLFIKGTANKPACKYSRQAIDILKESRAPIIRTVNVLDDPDLRSGIKRFSNYPNIPQLYVRGQFVGGLDAIIKMRESGTLKEILESS